MLVVALILALRLPFVNHAIQGDDVYYLAGAEHAQIEPLHPNHARFLFMGDLVDMRGNTHPFYSWAPAAVLALVGDIREIPFHLFYILFSVLAGLSMWLLATRFSQKPLLATLLFLATPAFVINGNSLEADVPFLGFWMASVALFIYAADRASTKVLFLAAAAAAGAAVMAYQAVFLTPILALYLCREKRTWKPAWIAMFAAPAALAALQVWERSSGGALPAGMLAGYLQSYGFEAFTRKGRGAVALVVHLGWMISPLILLARLAGSRHWQLACAGAASIGAFFYDGNPLFWISIGLGVWMLCACARQGFLGGWVWIFFALSVMVFFAGSARYLLPVAAPLAILASNTVEKRILWAGFALQMSLSLGLALSNYQHWDAYRTFAAKLASEVPNRRVWVNGEWGLRYYVESWGGLPVAKGQTVRPGDVVVSSDLAIPLPLGAPLAPLSQTEIRPRMPLRLISLSGQSAYSVAAGGLLPFEISRGPIDVIRAGVVMEPELSLIDPRDPKAGTQILSGLYPDGWSGAEAVVVVKVPPGGGRITASFYIPPSAPARRLQLIMGGQIAQEQSFPEPGS